MPTLRNARNHRRNGRMILPAGSTCIGRDAPYINPPRDQSCFHNPFKGPGAAQRFRFRLQELQEQNPQRFQAELEALRDRDLVCWCSPKPGHGDALMRALYGENYQREGKS